LKYRHLVFGFSFDVGRWMFDVGRSSFHSVLNVQYWVFGFSFDVGRSSFYSVLNVQYWVFGFHSMLDVGCSMLDVHLFIRCWTFISVNRFGQKTP